MLRYLRKVMRTAGDRGASAVEYGLMVAAIAAVIVTIVFGLGGVVANVFTKSCQDIGAAADPVAAGANGAVTPPKGCPDRP
jgi:pilus assembly protein Flp/PilA